MDNPTCALFPPGLGFRLINNFPVFQKFSTCTFFFLKFPSLIHFLFCFIPLLSFIPLCVCTSFLLQPFLKSIFYPSLFLFFCVPSLSRHLHSCPRSCRTFLTSMTGSERCSISRGCERDQAGPSLSYSGPQRQDGLQQNISTNKKAPAFVCTLRMLPIHLNTPLLNLSSLFFFSSWFLSCAIKGFSLSFFLCYQK